MKNILLALNLTSPGTRNASGAEGNTAALVRPEQSEVGRPVVYFGISGAEETINDVDTAVEAHK
jgi:hypothetical protein